MELTDYFQLRSSIQSLEYGGNSIAMWFRNWLYKDAIMYLDRRYNKFCDRCMDIAIKISNTSYHNFDSVEAV